MGMFDTLAETEAMPTEGTIRGLTGELAAEADAAIADGLVRKAPFNAETERAVAIIKRYLNQQDLTAQVRTVGGVIHWRVVEKKELTEDHKAKMMAGLERARAAKKADKNPDLTTALEDSLKAAETPSETPKPAQGAKKAG